MSKWNLTQIIHSQISLREFRNETGTPDTEIRSICLGTIRWQRWKTFNAFTRHLFSRPEEPFKCIVFIFVSCHVMVQACAMIFIGLLLTWTKKFFFFIYLNLLDMSRDKFFLVRAVVCYKWRFRKSPQFCQNPYIRVLFFTPSFAKPIYTWSWIYQ